ncbi:MAG: sigma-54 interaction domain-containing protein, partial [Gemmatimonadales bacterium]
VGGAEADFVGTLPDLEVRGETVVVGADPSLRLASAMVRAGAEDYFALPDDLVLLRSHLSVRVERLRRLRGQRDFTARESARYRFDELLGESPALRRTLAIASKIIPHPGVTVLITGETGTGKELVARAIHYNGPRRSGPFVDVNCAAIPERLLESELFGHEKGSFTGATAAKPGLFEVANRGSIFLDEIGHLPLELQGKLLRALEQRMTRRIGSTTSHPVDVRVIAATHVDLAAAVRDGLFREDLYYRLNVVQIELPPLRERGDDVVLLANHFLDRFATEYRVERPKLTDAARRRLLEHRWDGNIRELRNLVERSLLLHDGRTLDAADLAFRVSSAQAAPAAEFAMTGTLAEMIRSAACATLERCGGNKSETARRLGVSRSRLARLLDGQDDEDAD